MNTIVLQPETLNLPEQIARIFKGNPVEFIVERDLVIMKPIDPIAILDEAYGMCADSPLTVEKFYEMQRDDVNDFFSAVEPQAILDELLGINVGGHPTVEEFMKMKKEEKELEFAQEERLLAQIKQGTNNGK
jgi:hypothetical protein